MSLQFKPDPVDYPAILKALGPERVVTLAELSGSTLGDLMVRLQLMPSGDRIEFAKHGLIELEGGDIRGGLGIKAVKNDCLEAIVEAAHICAQVAQKHQSELLEVLGH